MGHPFDAELIMVHVVGLNVGHVEVHCREEESDPSSTSRRQFPQPCVPSRVVPGPANGPLLPPVY